MKKYIGGYAILDLTSPTIYKDALALENIDKPIVVYQSNAKPCFIDTFVIDSDNDVVIINGSLTIASDNTISGEMVNHLYCYNFEMNDSSDRYILTFESNINFTSVSDIFNYLVSALSKATLLFMYDVTNDKTQIIKGLDGLINSFEIQGYDTSYGSTFDISSYTMEDINKNQLF